MDILDDETLIRFSRDGSTEAQGVLCTRHYPRVLRAVIGRTGNTEDAEEITQNTFMLAMERIGSFRGESRFYTWLYRIAMNQSVSYKRRNPPAHLDVSEFIIALADKNVSNGLGHMVAEEYRLLIESIMNSIQEAYREILVLNCMNGLKPCEIARELDIPDGTVRSRLKRGKKKFMELYSMAMNHYHRDDGQINKENRTY